MNMAKNINGTLNPNHAIKTSFLYCGLPENVEITEWNVSHLSKDISTDEYLNALAKKISEEIGVRDMKISKRSISSGGGKGGSSRTRNDDVIERPVLLPEEIVSLRDKKNKARNIAIREIITSEFSRPFIANKIIWFEEPEFKRRVDIARNNHVDIPNLFTQEVMDEIAKIAEIYLPKAGGKKVMVAGGNVITNPDLDNHDKTDVSE
jgi:type IV secretion system protein VirD4